MKIIIILFGIVATVLATERETVKLSQALADKIKELATPCADENNLDHSIILKIPNGSVPDDESGRKFIYCFSRAAGYITEDGHLNVDNVADVLKGHPLQEKFREALKKCNEITKENPLVTAMAMHKCFAERSPVRFSL